MEDREEGREEGQRRGKGGGRRREGQEEWRRYNPLITGMSIERVREWNMTQTTLMSYGYGGDSQQTQGTEESANQREDRTGRSEGERRRNENNREGEGKRQRKEATHNTLESYGYQGSSQASQREGSRRRGSSAGAVGDTYRERNTVRQDPSQQRAQRDGRRNARSLGPPGRAVASITVLQMLMRAGGWNARVRDGNWDN